MQDRHRPSYHFAADNWMNDPIPFFAEGVYHLYYQYNPFAAVWGHMHWGHASSKDLLHWETLPVAIAPGLPALPPGQVRDGGSAPGPDSGGVFTGCITRSRTDGLFYALYTGVFPQTQCVAVSRDLIAWTKPAVNPVVAERPPVAGALATGQWGDCFRDPQAFIVDGVRYVIVGGEQPDGKGGAALLYRIEDESGMSQWTYLHPLFLGGPETGHDFECPDFFPLLDEDSEPTGQWLLITSRNKTWWHLGTLDTESMRFDRSAWGECDGGAFYAAKSITDADGRRLLFGWVTEARSQEEQVAAGWSGLQALPRQVFGRKGELSVRFAPASHLPVSEEYPPFVRENLRIEAGERVELTTAVDSCEVLLTLASENGGTVELLWPGGERLELPCLTGGERTTLFIDRSVVEVFETTKVTTYRIYPAETGTVRIAIRAGDGKPALVARAEVREAR